MLILEVDTESSYGFGTGIGSIGVTAPQKHICRSAPAYNGKNAKHHASKLIRQFRLPVYMKDLTKKKGYRLCFGATKLVHVFTDYLDPQRFIPLYLIVYDYLCILYVLSISYV